MQVRQRRQIRPSFQLTTSWLRSATSSFTPHPHSFDRQTALSSTRPRRIPEPARTPKLSWRRIRFVSPGFVPDLVSVFFRLAWVGDRCALQLTGKSHSFPRSPRSRSGRMADRKEYSAAQFGSTGREAQSCSQCLVRTCPCPTCFCAHPQRRQRRLAE